MLRRFVLAEPLLQEAVSENVIRNHFSSRRSFSILGLLIGSGLVALFCSGICARHMTEQQWTALGSVVSTASEAATTAAVSSERENGWTTLTEARLAMLLHDGLDNMTLGKLDHIAISPSTNVRSPRYVPRTPLTPLHRSLLEVRGPQIVVPSRGSQFQTHALPGEIPEILLDDEDTEVDVDAEISAAGQKVPDFLQLLQADKQVRQDLDVARRGLMMEKDKKKIVAYLDRLEAWFDNPANFNLTATAPSKSASLRVKATTTTLPKSTTVDIFDVPLSALEEGSSLQKDDPFLTPAKSEESTTIDPFLALDRPF